jgi:HK97 family phage portal protein
MGAVTDFLGNLFKKKADGSTETISLKDHLIESESERLSIDIYSIFTAVEMLSNLMANCEFKVFEKGIEKKELLWARLNYKPNINQSATEFWREYYRKLLFDGEALAFESFDKTQWLIADGFNKSDYEVREKYFTDVYRGDFQARGAFPMSEVIYISYPNKNVTALRAGLLQRYDQLLAAATESYELGTGNKAFVNINGAFQGNDQARRDYTNYINDLFKSFFKNKNAVMPLFNGTQASFANSSTAGRSTVDDITKIVTDSITRAAQAYKISPALLTGEIAGMKDALNFTLTSAIDPLANAVSEQLTIKFFPLSEIAKGSHIIADTTNIKHIDIFDISGSVDKLISSGFVTPDEARIYAGLEPTGEESMNKHYITKNYGTTDDISSAGGDGNV